MSGGRVTAAESYLGKGQFPPPFQVVRHVTSFLKWRFSNLPSGAYRWDPASESLDDQGGSEIFIGADTPIDPVKVGQRPAITVLRSHGAFQGVGIGDLAYVDLRSGAQVRMDLFPTHIMVNVLSELPIEAERIAWFVAEQIWSFREEIVVSEPSLLYLGARLSISPPSPAGSIVAPSTDVEWTVVVVTIPAYLQHATTKLPLNKPILNKFKAEITAQPPAKEVEPTVPLQGTAVAQRKLSDSEKNAAIIGPADLPQEGGDVAESTEPLTVAIEVET